MRIGAVLIGAVVGIALIATTASRVAVWQDERALWASAASHAPLKPRAWVNLGRAHALRGEPVLAMAAYEHALALSAARPDAERRQAALVSRLNLALVWNAQGRQAEAQAEARQARRDAPNHYAIQGAAAWILARE